MTAIDLLPLHELTHRILGCAVTVHKTLGPGLPEYSYETSLALEMDANRISYVREQPIAVRYRNVVVGWHRPDFIVENAVVVEIKAVVQPHPVFTKQVLTYLKVTHLRVGLLINFDVPSMAAAGAIRRFVL
jgi:GxxExxY protein